MPNAPNQFEWKVPPGFGIYAGLGFVVGVCLQATAIGHIEQLAEITGMSVTALRYILAFGVLLLAVPISFGIGSRKAVIQYAAGFFVYLCLAGPAAGLIWSIIDQAKR